MARQNRPPSRLRSNPLLSFRESATSTELILRKPSARYIDQFLQLRCTLDLQRLGLFPNAKEITETLAAVRAVFMYSRLDRHDPNVHLVSVGDGATPRTAATFAFRTNWTCHAVDPQLDVQRTDRWEQVRQLTVLRARVEEVDWHFPDQTQLVVVAVHAHVELAAALESIGRTGAAVAAAVAIPCCGYEHDAPGLEPVADYEDWGIWSEWRTVKVWTEAATSDGRGGGNPTVNPGHAT